MNWQLFTADNDSRTLRSLLLRNRIIEQGMLAEPGFLQNLLGEIWNHPLNAAARDVQNRTVVSEGGVDTIALDPDESIYLPAPLPGHVLFDEIVVTSEKSMAEVCAKIKKKVALTSRRVWPSLSPKEVYQFTYNANFRAANPDALSKGISQGGKLRFPVVRKDAQVVVAAPGGSNKAVATPRWLHQIWADIETLRTDVTLLEGYQQQISELRAKAGVIYSAASGCRPFSPSSSHTPTQGSTTSRPSSISLAAAFRPT